MGKVSKYTLNPLAACFVPLSMKMCNGSTESFQTAKYENPVAEYFKAKQGVISTIGNQQTTATEPFGVSKEMLSSIDKKNVSDNPLAIVANSTPHVSLKTMDESIPETLNGDETSDEHLKRTVMGGLDKSLTVLDTSQLQQPVLKKSKAKLTDRSKLHMKLLFQTRNELDMNLCIWMELQITINVHFAFLLKSNFFSVSESKGNKLSCSNIVEEKVEDCNSNWDEWSSPFDNGGGKTNWDECLFPSESGWIMPSDVSGNSLELRDTYSKKCVHTSVSERDQYGETENIKDEDQPLDVNDEPFSLDHYTSELKAIIKDVCDSVDRSLSLSHDDVGERQTEVSTGKRPVWETASEKDRSDSVIVDDGFHPLLQEDSSVNTDDTDISSIEKLLGEALSFGSIPQNESFPGQSGCILPCSVWCDNVPPPAKDTYKRFIKKCDSESFLHRKATDSNGKQYLRKQIYKRCFSADDAPKSSNYGKGPLQSASSISKERSLLLRKDSVDYTKCSTSAFEDRDRKEKTSNFFDRSTKDCCADGNASDLWSPYYGVNSKWQPLPDCVPLSELAQKQSYKRARDMRRQKSIC